LKARKFYHAYEDRPDPWQYAPYAYWMRDNRRLQQFTRDILLDPPVEETGHLSRSGIEDLLRRQFAGEVHKHWLITLLMTWELFRQEILSRRGPGEGGGQ
jgi:hypothetical protein